ncbi:histidine kinase 1 [Rhynchospora pubera]|uniref:histidine kinase n=1 Tax=Rhynchospora pubera TaxID=906938 RepID=A0AAV8E4Q8_9POAL|nr:histidine kinase 1 [Rhynchospora pubera]
MALFTFFKSRSKIQEAILQAELIKQKEAVQQAERKSMNKSMAFARASHDVRNLLHSIIGLIEICRDQTSSNSDLGTNLAKMNDCAIDLLDILNTILDTSKVESGKMHLEQTEFNISQIIEKSVDAFNVLAEKKGLEMIWDPCDYSILKLGSVIGDRQRFKQILDNLLSNAVKFTSEGKIVVRGWASKPKVKLPNISCDHGLSISHKLFSISRSTLRKFGRKIKQQDVHSIQNDPDSVELTFEVDDTGIGIPVEKRASVFENYVQVKEESPEGTGLGLGIVQSFVRLMGGEIRIKDKEPGEKGTCFKFNILLKSEEGSFQETSKHKEANQYTVRQTLVSNYSQTVKVRSLLIVEGCETMRILQTWIESLGIKVWTANQAEHISLILEKMKNNIKALSKSDSVLLHKTSTQKSNSSENEGVHTKQKNSESLPRDGLFSELPLKMLVIVDISNRDPMEILSTLIKFFKENTNLYCKVVCIADSKVTEKDLNEFIPLPCDLFLRKPIHGSRLHKLFQLIQELDVNEELCVDRIATSQLNKPQREKQPVKPFKITEETSTTVQDENSFRGKHVLLVDDRDIMRIVGSQKLSQLGAEVEVAVNGLEALNLVKKKIEAGFTRGKHDHHSFAYSAIFMDCQMPVMDGYEAARQIRKEESRYGIHIPIIALSAEKSDEGIRKAFAAGMDQFLEKPLDKDKVLDLFKLERY